MILWCIYQGWVIEWSILKEGKKLLWKLVEKVLVGFVSDKLEVVQIWFSNWRIFGIKICWFLYSKKWWFDFAILNSFCINVHVGLFIDLKLLAGPVYCCKLTARFNFQNLFNGRECSQWKWLYQFSSTVMCWV